MELTAVLFREFSMKMMTPSTLEVIDLAKRALKSFFEPGVKDASLKCCLDLVRSNPNNLSQYLPEALKVGQRALGVAAM